MALEIGFQLEKSGHQVFLILIDGSPSFVKYHIKNFKGLKENKDAFKLAYIAKLFSGLDLNKVNCPFFIHICMYVYLLLKVPIVS